VATTHLADGAVTAAKLAQNGCTSGQVMKWNGSAWSCGTASGGGASTNGTLIANFDFEEATGTSMIDSSGLGNNATFVSGIALGSIGHTGNGANFSGGMATIAAGNTFPDSPQIQMEAWVRPTSDATSAPRVIATKPGVWAFRLVGGASYEVEFSVTLKDGTTCTATSTSAAIPTNTYTQVQGWYDGLSVGVSIGGPNAPVGGIVMQRVRCEHGVLAQVPGGVINIGAAAAATNQFLGLLDELRIHNIVTSSIGKTCPLDMANAGAFCIEKTANAAAVWEAQVNLCQSRGRRLCSMGEWLGACNARTTLGLTIPFTGSGDLEFVDEFWVMNYYSNGAYYSAMVVMGGTQCNRVTEAGWQGGTVGSDYNMTSYPGPTAKSRCCL
jgi:hypothetical protein